MDPSLEEVRAAAERLGHHPQDHGWRELYRLFASGLQNGHAAHLASIASGFRRLRPDSSSTHFVTVLGIAVKEFGTPHMPRLLRAGPVADRLRLLESILQQHRQEIERVLLLRQNSFTAVRRFLIPQIILAAYGGRAGPALRFADLGTGLGLVPRQLNARGMFERFVDGLVWADGVPAYRDAPLAARYGIDRPPMPDLAWVCRCYGASSYYATLRNELLDVLDNPTVKTADVRYAEVDLLDHRSLATFIRNNRINAVNLSYVLYELDRSMRPGIVETLSAALLDPALIILTEPNRDLAGRGCRVTVSARQWPRPLELCEVSDGHFRGSVRPLRDYERFTETYPIPFDRP